MPARPLNVGPLCLTMRRILRNIILAVLAVLCVALVLQWPASYVSRSWFALRRADVTYNAVSNRGWILLQRAHLQYPSGVKEWHWLRGSG